MVQRISSTRPILVALAALAGLPAGCAATPAEAPMNAPADTRPDPDSATASHDATPGDPGPSPTLGAGPPAVVGRTVVLFGGRTWSRWRTRDGAPSPWTVEDDGTVRAGGGDAVTAATFGDHHLHLEFMCPVMPGQSGQARANSGVYVQGRYEVQVLDTFGQEPAMNGCGAVYSIAPPLVNAARPAGTWQTYDILFRTARLDPNDPARIVEPARITVLHNGILIHNNLELPKVTPGGLDDRVVTAGPLLLQDHGDPVRYRNIWVVEE